MVFLKELIEKVERNLQAVKFIKNFPASSLIYVQEMHVEISKYVFNLNPWETTNP